MNERGNACGCGRKFRDGEDYRDHLPCGTRDSYDKPMTAPLHMWWMFVPSWSTHCATGAFEDAFGAPYKGPGWYNGLKDGTQKLLAVPLNATRGNVWKQAYEGDLVVYVWDHLDLATVEDTFNVIANAPTRTP